MNFVMAASEYSYFVCIVRRKKKENRNNFSHIRNPVNSIGLYFDKQSNHCISFVSVVFATAVLLSVVRMFLAMHVIFYANDLISFESAMKFH